MATLPALELIATRHPPVRDVAVGLGACPLLAEMTFQEKERLAQQLPRYRAATAAGIFRKGNAGVFIRFVLDGKAELTKDADGGNRRRLASIGPGKTSGQLVAHLAG